MDKSVTLRGVCVRLGGVALLIAATALAGCGRKGPLELPPGTPPTSQTPGAAAAQENRILPVVDDPGVMQAPGTYVPQTRSAATQNLKGPINAPAPQTGKPFVLDPLL